ncbi:MAG: HAMP domain-containing histidine kinase, partial [Rhodospirillaceae bacterium]|nr:HAMP domain-containing histidine kinase [Rhodospirillaceae bacterium]
MSHELRTPLNSILGFSPLLGRLPSDPLSDRHQRHVQQILDNGKHLLNLIDQVLDLSRIESRETPMLIEDISVRAMIENCVAISMPLVQDAKIEMTVEDFGPNGCWLCSSFVLPVCSTIGMPWQLLLAAMWFGCGMTLLF